MAKTIKNKGGRPLKFKSVKKLESAIAEYFTSCWQKKLDMFGNPIKNKETKEYVLEQVRPYTISGLAAHLETDRKTILNYSKREKFFPTIKKAQVICEAYAEERLFMGRSPAGAIFNLKNNYQDWRDKLETDNKHNHKGDLKVNIVRYAENNTAV